MTVKGLFAAATNVRELALGDVVFREGDTGAEMYGVISGSVQLQHRGQVLAVIGPDGTFGELAIIDHAPRSLDAVVAEPTSIAVIDERTFLYLVHETPTFALSVMRSLTSRIREIDAQRDAG